MSEAKKEMRTMTLTPEEVTFLAARAADDEFHADGLDWITRMLMMHEAELRKRWFDEPICHISDQEIKTLGIGLDYAVVSPRKSRDSQIPLYAAPKEPQ